MYGHYQLPAINRHIYHNWRPPRCRTLAAVKSASSLRWRQLWCHKANSLLLVNKPRKSRFDNFLSDREAESVKDHCARLVLFYFSVKWLFADSRAHALCAHDQIAHCATWESILNLLRPLYILASNFYTLSLVVCAAVLATYDILGLVPDFQRFQPIAQSAMRS